MIINFKYKNFNSAKLNFFTFIHRNNFTILIILLFVIIATRTFYDFINIPTISSTESRLDSFPTNDFYTSIYQRTEQMIKGRNMDIVIFKPNVVSATGQTLPLLFSPFLTFFKPDRYISYFFFLGLTAIAFIIFFLLLMRKSDKDILNTGLIFLIAFLLSEPGFLGIYMGNADILLAPLTGILILIVFYFLPKKSISFVQAIGLGVLAGSLVNTKITLLPFILVAVLFSKRIFLIFAVTLVTFITLVYAPNFFGSPSSIVLYLNKVITWDGLDLFWFHTWANHSVYAVASFFTTCVEKNTCDTQIANKALAMILFLFTFVIPFLIIRPIKKIVINKDIFIILGRLIGSKEFALVLFVLSDAFINLSFKIVYDYRLFFSIPVTLILLKEAAKVKHALAYCYVSMFSLLLGGIWAIQLSPNEPWTIDARLIKLFIIFHYFFLIFSALTYWKESQKNQLQ